METKPAIHGERLRQLRDNSGRTQAEVAARLSAAGVSINQAFLSQVERGDKSVSLETLVAMAHLFEVNTDYLLGLSDDPAARVDEEGAVVLYESLAEQRVSLQQVFSSIERLPEDLRVQFYDALRLLYLGVMHKRKERSR